MQKRNKAPDIRYDINANNWEFMAFKEVFDITVPNNSLSRAELNYESGYIKSIHYGDILIKYKSYVNCNIDEIPYITNGNISKYRNQILKDGDIIFADAAEDETVGKAVELVNVEKSYIVSGLHTIVFRPNIKFGKYWLGYYINSKKFHQQLLPLMQGTKVLSLNKKSISETYLIFPKSLKEQESIGYFFYFLDNMISYQQIFLKKLEDLKQSMLEKMFPKQGQTVPEIRFAEFSGEWELKKIGDCFKERIENMPDGELLSVTINDGVKKFSELGRHDNSNEDKSKYKKVCVGDIAYNSMRMWQGASGYSLYNGIVSPAYTVLSPNLGIYSKYFAYLFKLPEMLHIFQINSQGITSDTWNLKFPKLSEIQLFVPKDINEQKIIANYFSKLDSLITLYKKKIEKLQKIRSFFLDKMFV